MSPRARRPRCADCNTATNPHPWPHEFGGYVWLCGPCAYLRQQPETAAPVLLPDERPALPLQRERLF